MYQRNYRGPHEDDVIVALMVTVLVLTIWLAGMYTIEAEAAKSEPEPEITQVEADTMADLAERAAAIEPLIPATVLEPYEPEIDWRVQEQLAVGIYREGGGDSVCDDCRVRIGDVILNRVADPRFPDTLEEVLTQKGQYGTMHQDGITFPKRAAQPEEFHAVQRAYDTAEAILTGTHSELYGQGYIYQSEFPDLGHDAFEHCGIYFAKG